MEKTNGEKYSGTQNTTNVTLSFGIKCTVVYVTYVGRNSTDSTIPQKGGS